MTEWDKRQREWFNGMPYGYFMDIVMDQGDAPMSETLLNR